MPPSGPPMKEGEGWREEERKERRRGDGGKKWRRGGRTKSVSYNLFRAVNVVAAYAKILILTWVAVSRTYV